MIKGFIFAATVSVVLFMADPAHSQRNTGLEPVIASDQAEPVEHAQEEAIPVAEIKVSGRGYFTAPGGQGVHAFEIVDHSADLKPVHSSEADLPETDHADPAAPETSS